jgi:hypothetical protein
MTQTSRFLVKRVAVLAGVLATGALLALLAGCSDDDDSTPPPSGGTPATTFVGAFTNGVENGKITVVINSTSLARRFEPGRSLGPLRAGAATVTASATLKFEGGGTQTVTGTYDPALDSLWLSNAEYSFYGEYEDDNPPPSVGGTYEGPDGPGAFGALAGGAIPFQIYLGSFQSDSTDVAGTFNLAIRDTIAGAIVCPKGSTSLDVTFLEGTATGAGAIRSISISNTEPGLTEVSATGTVDTGEGTASGVWSMFDSGEPKGDNGTWSATYSP